VCVRVRVCVCVCVWSVSLVQGAYVGVTTGLILTLWIGIGWQVYKPPELGHIPPPVNKAECPYRNVSLNDTGTELPTSSTHLPGLSSTDRVEDKYVFRKSAFSLSASS